MTASPFTESRTRYLPSDYPTTSYPDHRSTVGGETSYPTSAWPAGSYPAAGNPADNRVGSDQGPPRPAPADPARDYPAANAATTRYPATDRPTAVDPRYGYRWTDPSLGTAFPPGYDAGGNTRYSQPGVARFQGGIEKPTGTDVYDPDRSSIH
jgi:hypothetical protein